jgi:hypothetical protein
MAFGASANPAHPAILSVAEWEAGMADQQFHIVLRHLQVMIALLGIMTGVMLAVA